MGGGGGERRECTTTTTLSLPPVNRRENASSGVVRPDLVEGGRRRRGEGPGQRGQAKVKSQTAPPQPAARLTSVHFTSRVRLSRSIGQSVG